MEAGNIPPAIKSMWDNAWKEKGGKRISISNYYIDFRNKTLDPPGDRASLPTVMLVSIGLPSQRVTPEKKNRNSKNTKRIINLEKKVNLKNNNK